MKKILIIAVILMVVSGISIQAETKKISVETMPPVVVKTVPQAGDIRVDPDLTEIRVTFSEPVVQSSLETAFRIFPPTAGEWNWSGDGTAATFNPLSGLLPQATYDVEIPSSVIDLSGNPMKDR